MFIQKEFDENDGRAKAKFRELFAQTPRYNKCTLIEPSDQYAIDFEVNTRKGLHIANIEVEVKNAWHGFNFAYDDIQILPRKQKFWMEDRYNKGKPTMFVMFNSDLSNHLVITSEKMVEIFTKGNTRCYGTEKTRNDEFFIAKKKDVMFGFFGKKEEEKTLPDDVDVFG